MITQRRPFSVAVNFLLKVYLLLRRTGKDAKTNSPLNPLSNFELSLNFSIQPPSAVTRSDVERGNKGESSKLERGLRGKLILAVYLLLTFCILSCAPPIKYNPGLTLLKNHELESSYPAPDTLRSVLKITIHDSRKKNTITGLISAVPLKRYKMEFMGLMGVSLGSFYWVKDSLWSFVNYREKSIQQGENETMEFPFIQINSAVLHGMLGFLWGKYIPGGEYSQLEKKEGKGIFQAKQTGDMYLINEKSGLVESITFQNRYKVSFSDYFVHNNRPVARSVKVYEEDVLKLKFHVTKIEDNPSWKKSPFYIKVPKG